LFLSQRFWIILTARTDRPNAIGGVNMPKLTVEGAGEFEVPVNKRLVLALEDECGVDQLHACGGNARCTTCRVEFVAGEPDKTTRAKPDKLVERGLLGEVRLSCQILCDHDMSVHPVMTLESEGWTDTGPPPAPEVTPEPEWIDRSRG
jgi:ferredoxin